MTTSENIPAETPTWFVLRDLKRSNSKSPAYKVLPQKGIEVFTPMHWVLRNISAGRTVKQEVPYIPSLLFAKAHRRDLDPIIENISTLQYRFLKGAPQNTPMTVPSDEMTRFIRVVSTTPNCIYYAPDEVTPDMLGREVMIKGGPLDGSRGKLLKLRGSKKKRMVIGLEGILFAAVEVESDYIEFL